MQKLIAIKDEVGNCQQGSKRWQVQLIRYLEEKVSITSPDLISLINGLGDNDFPDDFGYPSPELGSDDWCKNVVECPNLLFEMIRNALNGKSKELRKSIWVAVVPTLCQRIPKEDKWDKELFYSALTRTHFSLNVDDPLETYYDFLTEQFNSEEFNVVEVLDSASKGEDYPLGLQYLLPNSALVNLADEDNDLLVTLNQLYEDKESWKNPIEVLKKQIDLFEKIISNRSDPKSERDLISKFFLSLPTKAFLPRMVGLWHAYEPGNLSFRERIRMLKDLVNNKSWLLQIENVRKKNPEGCYLNSQHVRNLILKTFKDWQDPVLVAWALYVAGDISDPYFSSEIMNQIQRNRTPLIKEAMVEDAICYFLFRAGILEQGSRITKGFPDHDWKRLNRLTMKYNFIKACSLPKIMIRGVGGNRDHTGFMYYRGVEEKEMFTPCFYGWPNFSSWRLGSYVSDEGGFVIWRGKCVKTPIGAREGEGEEMMIEPSQISAFIVSPETFAALKNISQCSETDIRNSDILSNFVAQFEDRYAILDILARGLKVPISSDPEELIFSIWRHCCDGTYVLTESFQCLAENQVGIVPLKIDKSDFQTEGTISDRYLKPYQHIFKNESYPFLDAISAGNRFEKYSIDGVFDDIVNNSGLNLADFESKISECLTINDPIRRVEVILNYIGRETFTKKSDLLNHLNAEISGE